MTAPTIGCVVLTQGARTEDLLHAVKSVHAQHDVDVDLVVVANGDKPEDLPPDVRMHVLPENRGVPGGRNAGIDEVDGDLLLFLDDDAYLDDPHFLADASRMFAEDPELGVVQPRVVDPTGKRSPRRYVPRLRVGDDRRSSNVVALWEGVLVARRRAVEAAGRWWSELYFMHEGVDLAWRVMDAGYTVRYCGELQACHPALPVQRHAYVLYMGARNRVWLARRNLPTPLAPVYVAVWFGIDLLRARSVSCVRQRLRGYRDGVRQPCGSRRPISWRTVARMTRAGRPPVI